MKKLFLLTVALCLFLSLSSAALAVDKGDYPWQTYTLTVTDIDTQPMFSPADMKADERALAVKVETSPELVGDETLRDALYAQARLIDAGGNAYAPGALLSKENSLTFVFAVPKGADVDSLSFQCAEAAQQTAAMPEAYVGNWQGDTGDIHLAFTVHADGTGNYSFEQNGYSENYDFAMEAGDETFSVSIPADNQLGITACDGTYQYANGVLTLAIETRFQSGRTFSYTVPCTHVEP